jgi:hypothetical protein
MAPAPTMPTFEKIGFMRRIMTRRVAAFVSFTLGSASVFVTA